MCVYMCVYECIQTQKENNSVWGQCIYMYNIGYLSLHTHLTVAKIFCVAFKVSGLVFYPLLSLIPMN